MKLNRKSIVSTVAALALTSVAVASVGAQGSGLSGSAWWTSIQFQNTGTTSGSLQLQAVGGTTITSPAFTFASGAGLTYNPGFAPNYGTGGNRIGFCGTAASACDGSATADQLPAGFSGAVVASSDVPVVAVGSVNNTLNGTTGNANGFATGMYGGVSAPATQLLFPVAKHNFAGNTVAYYIQAAGAQAVVTATFNMNDGSSHTKVATIAANGSALFDPADATPAVASSNCGAAATSPCLGSVSVIASSPVAGIALEFPETAATGFAGIIGASRAFAPADYGTTILAPVFKNDFFGNFSGWSIQNTSNVTATVMVTLTAVRIQTGGTATPGQQFTSTIAIGPNQQATLSKFRNNIGGMPAFTAAAGIATSDQPVVAVVNESNNSGVTPVVLSTYNAYNPAISTMKAASPLVKEFFPGTKTGANASGTSVTVQNAGTANATVRVIYTVVGAGSTGVAVGTKFTMTIGTNQGAGGNTQLLAPGASYVFNMVSDPTRASLYATADGSAALPTNGGINTTVLVTADQPVITLMQEDNKKLTGTKNDLANYEGFNLQ